MRSIPRAYFPSILARTASAACRSDRPSTNCRTRTRASWPNVAENTRLRGHEEVRAYWPVGRGDVLRHLRLSSSGNGFLASEALRLSQVVAVSTSVVPVAMRTAVSGVVAVRRRPVAAELRP